MCPILGDKPFKSLFFNFFLFFGMGESVRWKMICWENIEWLIEIDRFEYVAWIPVKTKKFQFGRIVRGLFLRKRGGGR